MEAVPIHRSPSASSLSSQSSLSNTLGGNYGDLQPPQRPPNIITRIKRLSMLHRVPSSPFNDDPKLDLPIMVGTNSKLKRSKSRKRNVRNKMKEWLLAALTIIMGGFIAGVFVITGIESAASSVRHKYSGTSRWNTTNPTISQAMPESTDAAEISLLPPIPAGGYMDPTEVPYAIEVMPDLTKLTTCSNPTVDDGVAFPLSMVDPGFISCYSCVLLTSPTSDARVVAVVVDSFIPQSNNSILINAKTYNKLNTAHESDTQMMVMWQPSNC
ncbi:hypothetical protein INT44_006102 [Umbelopsis vinacea]|uniref:Uncharacterized protein n=1 Tax=Umbelopsis vinacea TaxID=44442 RepID=A0A8H7Q1T0_9FUNG|nr:hypothetical protein INT44_006102 [Umbelopsis vinacea]KAI9282089.1 hypothetical protein BC943DRAFT_382527 [Umbelopsis sp. AD052]